MSMSIGSCMTGLGTSLAAIAGLRVYDFPADSVSTPAAVVAFPETVTYDDTMARGADRATFQVFIVISKVSDRAARDELALYMNGTGPKSVKVAIEGDETLGGAAQSTRVSESSVSTFNVGGIDYLAATFNIEVIA